MRAFFNEELKLVKANAASSKRPKKAARRNK